MNRIKTLRSNLAFNIIGAIVLMLVVFGLVISTLGFVRFTDAFKMEYNVSTYHMADTATTLVNGDHLQAYLAGEEREEYQQTKGYLDSYCTKINVSLIYVICVDQSDYGRFVSVFNPVNNAVDNSSYTEWELGHPRDTTNEEYRTKYRAIYELGSPYETVYRIRTTDGQHSHITTMVPVKGSDGSVKAILCMQRPISELYSARRYYFGIVILSTIFLALFVSVFTSVFIRRQFVEPLRKVSGEATRFARENTKGQELGEISRYEELANLAHSIDTMVNDETYIGNTIHHKQSTISYKNKKVVQNPKEEWVRVENTHEPIISKDLFDQVQDQIAARRRMQKDATTQIFAGLLKCADCGWSMSYGRNDSGNRSFAYYICGKHRAYRYKGGECTRHYIRYDVLYTYVLERIQHWAVRAEKDEDRLLEDLLQSGDRERVAAIKKQTTELKKSEKRKTELDNMFARMYEDWAAGRITESNFNMLSQRYQKEQEEQEQKIETCKATLAAGKQTVEDAQKWVELIKQIGVPKELTAELLNTLIEKIRISPLQSAAKRKTNRN